MADQPAAAETSEHGRRRHLLRPLAFALVLAAGVLAVIVSVVDARHEADGREEQITSEAGDGIGATVSGLVAGMSGAPSIVAADGSLGVDAFERYATDAIAGSPVQSLALVDLITAAERPALEAEIGHPVVDTAGSTTPSGQRDAYVVIRDVVPVSATTTQLIGVDLAVEPVRSEAITEATQRGTWSSAGRCHRCPAVHRPSSWPSPCTSPGTSAIPAPLSVPSRRASSDRPSSTTSPRPCHAAPASRSSTMVSAWPAPTRRPRAG